MRYRNNFVEISDVSIIMIRAFIIDDNKSFRRMLSMLFQETGYIQTVGESDGNDDYLDILAAQPIDIITMDIRLKSNSGIQETKKIIEKFPDAKVVAVTMYDEEVYCRQMFEAGASAFLTKVQVIDHLENVIQKILKGEKYFPGIINKSN